jgi:hypothetical protein
MPRLRLAPILVAGSIAILALAAAWRPILDYDYFWQLASGALIAQTGEVPRSDPFSYSAPGARWVDLHWLFQLALHGLYALAGHSATRAFGAALGIGVVAVSAASLWRGDRPAVSGAALGLLVVGAASRFLVRPDTLSLLLAAASLAILHRDERANDRRVFWILPLQLVWANVHGFQAVGVAFLAMALLGELARATHGGMRADRARRLLGVLAGSALVALLNPNGLEGALFPLRQLGMLGAGEGRSLFGQAIEELRPTLEVARTGNAAAIAAPALLGMLALGAMALDRRGFSAFDALLWLALGVLALAAVRNVALYSVACAPIFARHLNAWLDSQHAVRSPRALRAMGVNVIVLLLVVTALTAQRVLAARGGPRGSSSPALAAFQYPEAAVDWIARERPPAPIYHRLGDGGYLVWRLWPGYQVLIDGRLEVFGAERYADFEILGGGGPDAFQRLDARYRFGTALLHFGLFPDLSLLSWLAAQPGWVLVHLDDVAAVFVRAEPGDERRWPRVDLDGARSFEPLDPSLRHPLDLWRRRSRVSILVALGRYDDARALTEETLSLYRDPRLEAMRSWFRKGTELRVK